MDYKKAKELFSKINIELTNDMYDNFCIYEKELLEWNEKINLTTITNDDEIWLKHFVDSATILEYISDNDSIIDVGTGAGFPSLPAKIINPSIKVILLDSLNKRIDFLIDVSNKMDLTSKNSFMPEIGFVHGRAEDFGKNKMYREKFEVVTARAVANLSTLCEYCLPFLKVGGKFICMKGHCEDELEDAKNAIEILGGKVSEVKKFNLAETDLERTLIIIEKIKKTPGKYPRKAGKPSEDPIR